MFGYDGTNLITSASITSVSSGTIAANRVAGNLVFAVHPDSTSGGTAATTAMTINPSGSYTYNSYGAGAICTDSSGNVTSENGTAGYALLSNGAGSIPTFQAITAGTVTSVSGGNNITITGTPTINPTVNVSGTTNHSLLLGNATGSINNLGVATNGQIPIGSTGADPVLATITAGSGVSIVNAGGSITISATGGSSFTWSVITANQTASVANGYFCNKAGTLALALPAVSAVGDVIKVSNENTALGVQFTQAAGQQILIGTTNTTSGATGTLTSSAVGDTLTLTCKTANTIWRVTDGWGNWTPA